MNKKTAGERKRTVTLVIGPKTSHQLDLYRKAVTKPGFEVLLTYTDLVGSMVTASLWRWSKDLKIPMDDGLITHFD